MVPVSSLAPTLPGVNPTVVRIGYWVHGRRRFKSRLWAETKHVHRRHVSRICRSDKAGQLLLLTRPARLLDTTSRRPYADRVVRCDADS